MNPRSTFRPALFAVLLPFAALGSVSAQTPTPSATTIPASKPATETSTPSPGAAVNTSTPAEKEVTGVRKSVLEKYDTNHNGVLDADERAAFEKDRAARKAENLQKYDKNHDGKLDADERAAMKADREKNKGTAAAKEKASPTP